MGKHYGLWWFPFPFLPSISVSSREAAWPVISHTASVITPRLWIAAFFKLSVKSPDPFRAKCRTQECIKRVNIILYGINFLATLSFICCWIDHYSSFIRSLLILSFLLQLLLLLIILCHLHVCCLTTEPLLDHSLKSIVTWVLGDPNVIFWSPWNTIYQAKPWFISHVEQTRTCFIACCLTAAPRNHQTKGDRWIPEVCPAYAPHFTCDGH